MNIDVVAIQPLIALIAGILILLVPRILNYVVAIYLIFIGLIGLWPHIFSHVSHRFRRDFTLSSSGTERGLGIRLLLNRCARWL
jgi:Protein of unknown function (DUF3096)